MLLVLGNKNYSTWSWRAYLAMESFNLPREEIVVPLDKPETAASIAKYSPSGRVPVLIDDSIKVWDSLAICEYLAEKFPEKSMWPADKKARAEARSLCAEMHSSFQELRSIAPGNIRLRKKSDLSPAKSDIARIENMWTEYLGAYRGDYLFGKWSIADCFFAPVALRFQTYGVTLKGPAQVYCERLLKHPAVAKLQRQAAEETWTSPKYD
jgi:glutathione S-transferase